MFKELRKFIIKNFIVSAVLMFTGFIIFSYFLPEYYLPVYTYILLFLLFLHIIIHFLLIYSLTKKKNMFTGIYTITFFAKFLGIIAFIVAYTRFHKENTVPFIIVFLFLYLVFTITEIRSITVYLKSSRKNM